MLKFLYFENFVFFGVFLNYLKYVSYNASGRTNTKRERKLFLVFLKMSVTRCGRPDKHN